MYTVKTIALFLLIASANAAFAADKPFTGVFGGTGRACSGGAYIRTKTIEWNSTYSICKPSRYEVLEKNLTEKDHKRIVYRLKDRSKQCRSEVIEVEQVSRYGWNVSGYPSLEVFQKRDLPDWGNSPLPERQILSCPMVGPD
ncbi:hypothetical protein [Paraherbaspirillum soli]|uniref:Secreted protein n=1 Tax=Paraherbaspirillum soli TaxID=631222 RepID=A0ABW0MER5_9BURK